MPNNPTTAPTHSPGPFSVQVEGFGYSTIRDANGNEVARCNKQPDLQTHVADTNLLGAAPELLEAAEHIVKQIQSAIDDYMNDNKPRTTEDFGVTLKALGFDAWKVEAAIAKAKGESS